MAPVYHLPGEKAARALAASGFVVLIIMAIWILIDVVSGLFRLGLPGMVDWVEVLNVICIALALPYVTMQRKHIQIDLIQNYLSVRWKRILDRIALVVPFLFSALVAWRLSLEGWYSLKTWESNNVGIMVYWFPGKVALAFGFIMMALVVLGFLVSGRRGKSRENGGQDE